MTNQSLTAPHAAGVLDGRASMLWDAGGAARHLLLDHTGYTLRGEAAALGRHRVL